MDLTKPTSAEKVCHHCNELIQIWGYGQQECEECGEVILPLVNEVKTTNYIPPKGLNILSIYDKDNTKGILLKKGIVINTYFATDKEPKVESGNVFFENSYWITSYTFPNHKIDILICLDDEHKEIFDRFNSEFDPKYTIFGKKELITFNLI